MNGADGPGLMNQKGWKMVLSVFWDLNFCVRPKEERCILFKTEFYVARYPMKPVWSFCLDNLTQLYLTWNLERGMRSGCSV